MTNQAFKQEVPAIGISVEKGTSSVPDDGRFHIIVDGNVVFSSKGKPAALARYRSLRDDLLQQAGLEPKAPDPEEARRREREFYDLQAVMSESSQRAMKAMRKGGKGGSGGV